MASLDLENPSLETKRTLANRRNALKSTGPRTERGKDAARRNALKTGLTGAGTVLPPEIEEEARRRRAGWMEAHQPQTQDEIDLVAEGAMAMTLLTACWRELETARVRASLAAENTWERDRSAAAETLLRKLRKDPARTVSRLKLTVQGVRKLIAVWTELGQKLEVQRGWTPDQREIALDLLGVDAAFRDESSPVDCPGLTPEELCEQRLELIADEIRDLRENDEEDLAEMDEIDRSLVASGRMTHFDPEVARLVRYEENLSRRVGRAMSRLAPLKTQMRREARQAQAPKRVAHAPNPPAPPRASTPAPIPAATQAPPPTPPPVEKTKPTPTVDHAAARYAERLLQRLPQRSRRAEYEARAVEQPQVARTS